MFLVANERGKKAVASKRRVGKGAKRRAHAFYLKRRGCCGGHASAFALLSFGAQVALPTPQRVGRKSGAYSAAYDSC